MNKLAFLVLLAAVEPQDFVVFNRSISSFSDGNRKGVRLTKGQATASRTSEGSSSATVPSSAISEERMCRGRASSV